MNFAIQVSFLLCALVAVCVSAMSDLEKDKLYDLDELLTPKQYQEIFAKGDATRRKRAAAIRGYKWPNAVVAYRYGANNYGEKDRNMINRVFRNIEKHTCVRFVPRRNQKNYVNFIQDSGCYSLLGMAGTGAQPLSLNIKGCRDYGTIHHELMHALGIIHEQQRPDRDSYVRINWNNMDSKKASNFEKAKASATNYHGVPYDFSSLMQYYFGSFSNNGKDTMTPINERNAKAYVGHMWTKPPSFGDVKLINEMYYCSKGCNTKCSPAGFVDQNCKCITPYSFYHAECKGNETTGWCKLYKDYYEK